MEMYKEEIPLYSVLMTVYKEDDAKWIRVAIDSIINQTVAPSEILIVEDGRIPEELENVLDEYISKYGTLFRIIKNSKNKGLGAVLKQGVEECKYENIARMDADDISNKERCGKILDYMKENPTYSLVGCDCVEFVGDIDNIKGYVRLPKDPNEARKFAKRRVPIRHPSIIFKKSDVLKVGNYKPLRRSQEYDLVIRMLMAGMKISNVQEILFYIRVSDDFYTRRGGLGKAKLLAGQRHDFYKYGFYNFFEFILYASINIGMCIVPNSFRAFLYQKFLRKNNTIK